MSWSQTDLLIQGILCSPEELRGAVDSLRSQAAAKAAFLFVASGINLFTSLTTVAAANGPSTDHLLASVSRATSDQQDRAALANYVDNFRLSPRNSNSHRPISLNHLPSPLSQLIATEFPNAPLSVVHVTCPSNFEFSSDDGALDVAAILLLVDCASPDPSLLTAPLAAMVNGTAPVVTKRTEKMIRTLERHVSGALATVEAMAVPYFHHASQDDGEISATLQRELFPAILQCFSATVCAVYFRSPASPTTLVLEGGSPPEAFLKTITLSDLPIRPLIYDALQKEKILLARVDNVAELECIDPLTDRAAPNMDVLVVPLIDHLSGTTAFFPIGALVIGRVVTHPKAPLTFHDYLAARELSWRIGLYHSWIRLAKAHSRLDALSRRVLALAQRPSPLDSAVLSRDLHSFSTEPQSLQPGSLHQSGTRVYDTLDARPEIPIELLPSRELAETIARVAADITGSMFTTVRLLSPDLRYLVRFCSAPPIDSPDRFRSLPVKSNVITTEAAWTDTLTFARKVAGGKWVNNQGAVVRYIDPPVEREANAVICVPLHCNQRVCGSLTLEGFHGAAFRAHIPVALQAARLLTQLFSTMSSSWASTLLSMSTDLVLDLHRVTRASTRLDEAIQRLRALSDDDQRRMADVMELVQDSARALKLVGRRTVVPASPNADRENALSVAAIVQQFVADLKADRTVRQKAPIEFRFKGVPLGERALAPEHVHAFKTALGEVIANACNARLIGQEPVIWITFSIAFPFLRRCVNTHIQCKRASSVPLDVSHVLYRLPFTTIEGDPPHLGGFIAGNAMRGIGGDVYVAVNKTDSFETVIQVPVD